MTPASATFLFIVAVILTVSAWILGMNILQSNAPDWVDEHQNIVRYVLTIPIFTVPGLVTYIFIHKAAKKLRLSAAAKNTPGV
jgi:uncharacterized membrane protein YozB (DUF420 family)